VTIDHVVLGAGLMGRLLSLSLARQGARVRLIDAHGPDAAHSAARAAAAMLAPLAESAITELPVVRMGLHGLTRWPQLLQGLPQPVFFQQAGTLILWHRQDHAEAQRFERLIRRTHAALPELAAPRALHGAEWQAMAPDLARRFAQALHLPQEGQLDNRQLLDALLQALQEAGVELHWQQAVGATDEPALRALMGPGVRLIDCRGLGARVAWSQLRGVRGEVLRLYAPEVQLPCPTRLIHPRYPIYIAPKEQGLFVVGATEIESEDLSPTSVRSALELLSACYTVDPGFAEARILEMSTQARPTLPDNLPRLRVLAPDILQINGLYRHGYMISPAVHDAALEWLNTGQSELAQTWGLL
jgi:glycine oxidase